VIVGVDSQVVIYAGVVPKNVTESAKSAQYAELSRRAKMLLHNLRSERVVLPLIAISELLVPVPVSKHGLLIAALKELFVCTEFGERAASIAADIWARYKNVPSDRRYDDRHVMRADVKIIASAKAAGATRFYSHDHNCRTLAGLVMTASDLPKQPNELFFDQMLAEGLEERPKGTTRPRRRDPKKRKQ
jgi:hypothetical protein